MSLDFDVDDLDLDEELGYDKPRSDSDDDAFEEFDDAFFEDIDFEALGIDPHLPTTAKPGSQEKVLMLAARYAAGVPLWHNEDCYDHGPGAPIPVFDFRRLRS